MISELKPGNVLFIDIETAPEKESFEMLDERRKKLWEKRSAYMRQEDESPGDAWGKAGLLAEFGRIVCVSAGVLTRTSEPSRFMIKSFYGDDERAVLKGFSELLKKYKKSRDLSLCAHNGKEFDFPFLARRYIILGEKLPEILNTAGKKPWELDFIDTMDLWKFGQYRYYTSLALLCEVLGISNPKDDIDGSQVAEVYYKEKDYERIARYCEKDVLAVAQVLLKLRGEKLIPEENVELTGNIESSG